MQIRWDGSQMRNADRMTIYEFLITKGGGTFGWDAFSFRWLAALRDWDSRYNRGIGWETRFEPSALVVSDITLTSHLLQAKLIRLDRTELEKSRGIWSLLFVGATATVTATAWRVRSVRWWTCFCIVSSFRCCLRLSALLSCFVEQNKTKRGKVLWN